MCIYTYICVSVYIYIYTHIHPCPQLVNKVSKDGSLWPVLCSLPFLVPLPHKNNFAGFTLDMYRKLKRGKTVTINPPPRSLQVLLMAPSTDKKTSGRLLTS